MRSRALPLLALVAALFLGGGGVAAAAGSGDRAVPASPVSTARAEIADAPSTGAVTGVRDPFAHGRDARRGDVATLTAALVLAAGAAYSIIRSRRVRTTAARPALRSRPRGPPDLPAFVSN